jgi:hypothetical protein
MGAETAHGVLRKLSTREPAFEALACRPNSPEGAVGPARPPGKDLHFSAVGEGPRALTGIVRQRRMRQAVSRTRHVDPPAEREHGGMRPGPGCRATPALKGSHCASLDGGLDHTHRAEAREREAVLASPLRSAETTGSR